MPALQDFEERERRLEATIERAVQTAMNRAVNDIIKPLIEKSFRDFRKELGDRESLKSARENNRRQSDEDILWFPSAASDADMLQRYLPRKGAMATISSANARRVLRALGLPSDGSLDELRSRIRTHLCGE
ncbi:hypothetical protein TWF481_011338 [Arthrobotrys musiformis]|uniref:SAP domain-containing protein n=1 Tax=Arthrobotrys musiformis TaxID=47236 RepID=A0AAV9VY93_9PEZI